MTGSPCAFSEALALMGSLTGRRFQRLSSQELHDADWLDNVCHLMTMHPTEADALEVAQRAPRGTTAEFRVLGSDGTVGLRLTGSKRQALALRTYAIQMPEQALWLATMDRVEDLRDLRGSQ